MEQGKRIRLEDCDEGIATLRQRLSAIKCSNEAITVQELETKHCVLVKRWLNLLTPEYITGLIILDKMKGKGSTFLINEPAEKKISYWDAFNKRIDGEEMSVKEKIHSMVDTRQMRATFIMHRDKVQVSLHWRAIYLPDFLLSDNELAETIVIVSYLFFAVMFFSVTGYCAHIYGHK